VGPFEAAASTRRSTVIPPHKTIIVTKPSKGRPKPTQGCSAEEEEEEE
jgi:hypothetical protein